MITRFSCAAALACAFVTSPVLARDATAPRAENYRGDLEDRAIRITGYGHWTDRDNPPLRTAHPLVEPVKWFDGTSEIARVHLADPKEYMYSSAMLTINADGNVTSCTFDPQRMTGVDGDAVCKEVAGQKFLPQLNNDGQAESGQFRVSFGISALPANADTPPRPLFTNQRDPRPMAMAMPVARMIDQFPPHRFEVNALYREPVWETAPQPGWGDHGHDGSSTGLIVYQDRDKVACRMVQSSGHQERDAAACGHALSQLAPDWSSIEQKRDWMVPLYILHKADSLVAIGPDPDRVRDTRISEATEAALVNALEKDGVLPEGRAHSNLVLYFTSDTSGNVIHCRVVTTAGNSARDIAACKAARATVTMEPREDVFGTPESPAGMFWRARPSEE